MNMQMTCEEFRERLEASLDEHRRAGAELAEHAAACGSETCRREWDDAQLLLHVARSLERPVSMGLVERTLADLAPRPAVAIAAPPVASRRKSPQVAAMGLGFVTAAALMMAVIVGLRPSPSPSGPASSIVRAPARPTESGDGPGISSAHLAARAPAFVADTVREGIDGRSLRDLPVLSPLVSTVEDTITPVGLELKEWVMEFRREPEMNMDSSSTSRPDGVDSRA